MMMMKTKKSKKAKKKEVVVEKKAKKETKKARGRPKRDKTVKKRAPKQAARVPADIVVHSDNLRPRDTGDSICEIVDINDGVIAALSDNLCNEWTPLSGHSDLCTAQETVNGGAVCSLASQCILQELQSVSVGIVVTNSGMAQGDINEGLLPYNQFRNVFPVNDAIFGVEMSGARLVAVLEDALDATANGNDAAYPCGAGIRYSVNMNAAKKSRLSNVQVRVGVLDVEWVAINLTKTYFIATTKSLLQGNHGYQTFGSIEDVIDLNASFYDLFTSCAVTNCPFTAMAASEYSTQQFSSR